MIRAQEVWGIVRDAPRDHWHQIAGHLVCGFVFPLGFTLPSHFLFDFSAWWLGSLTSVGGSWLWYRHWTAVQAAGRKKSGS